MSHSDCLFCRIVAGTIPADVVHDGERLLAFRDINAQAPLHVLVIPKEHIASLDAAGLASDLLGEALLLAAEIARREGVAEGGYRTVINTGDHGGQTVHHLHVHVLGGRALTWPPG
ncbi:MAG: histidine triad nucleotide-binding protein [Gemmatimonadota bacterium]|nr:histidine triad nucleotide-binding protein [Gemmatimonadota bacterium]MDH3422431.1 histidine triad nucleotide-binding protein [Gemmatimonadota bacterium]